MILFDRKGICYGNMGLIRYSWMCLLIAWDLYYTVCAFPAGYSGDADLSERNGEGIVSWVVFRLSGNETQA
jgi:hypothetical protein